MRTTLALLLVAPLLFVNCGGSPTEPEPDPQVRAVKLATSPLVAVGSQVALKLIGLAENGEEVDVTPRATWAATGVAGVSRDGGLTGTSSGSGTVSAEALGFLYEAPVTVVDSGSVSAFSPGAWTGTSRIVTCRALAVTASGSCAGIGQTRPWLMSLTPSSNRLAGSLTMYNLPATGQVEGFVDTDGAIWIGGLLRASDQNNAMTILKARLTLIDERIEGTMLIDRSFGNQFGLIVQREEHEVTAVRSGG